MMHKIEQIFSGTYYYGLKRMLGYDYDDPTNQESKNNLTLKVIHDQTEKYYFKHQDLRMKQFHHVRKIHLFLINSPCVNDRLSCTIE
jgi:hypothetical protein